MGGLGLNKGSHSLDHEHLLSLTPEKQYREIVKRAADRLPELDDHPHDLYEMLFSRKELEWTLKQYHARQST